MSMPPPYGGEPTNPDRRPLPTGWVQQYDKNYNSWFYVNTREDPPSTTWTHPAGPAQNQFAPPSGPPPSNDRGYNHYPYPQGGYNNAPPGGGYNQPQQYGGGYGNNNYSGGYNGPPQNNYGPPQGQGGYGGGQGYGGDFQGRTGWFGGGGPQQPVPVQQTKPKKSGFGLGSALALGAGGLLGGALLGEAFEHHEERKREEAYEQGFDQAQIDDGDYGNDGNYGDGFGGGDY